MRYVKKKNLLKHFKTPIMDRSRLFSNSVNEATSLHGKVVSGEMHKWSNTENNNQCSAPIGTCILTPQSQHLK